MPDASAPPMGITATVNPTTAAVTSGINRFPEKILFQCTGTKAAHRKKAIMVG